MSQKIQPVRADGNLLLCTLLLGNVAVNALLSIVMAQLTSGLVGFALATVIITIFGEIIPQVGNAMIALCLSTTRRAVWHLTGMAKMMALCAAIDSLTISCVVCHACHDGFSSGGLPKASPSI